MTELPVVVGSPTVTIGLVGNPNSGKTSLFNALTGLRARTANFPGITVDLRFGPLELPGPHDADLMDLPGLYSLDALSPEEQVTSSVLSGTGSVARPDVVVLVLDATSLERNLFLAGEVLELKCPTVVALNLIDAAEANGTTIDVEGLSDQLRCPVVPVSSRTRRGLNDLRRVLSAVIAESTHQPDQPSCAVGCSGCSFAARYDWAAQIVDDTVTRTGARAGASKLDRLLTSPFAGVAAFVAVMLGVFYLIFFLAEVPMGWVEDGFSWLGRRADSLLTAVLALPAFVTTALVFASSLAMFAGGYRISRMKYTRVSVSVAVIVSLIVSVLPADDLRSLVVDGIVGGLGGVIVFLPQICILFLFIALLEDSGYMARAAFVMERIMRRVGLPGKAFVPMLSAHACAIPGIMAARVIESRRDRLITIIVLPLLTCSARLPVYTMVATLLFYGSPHYARNSALLFAGAYLLGVVATLATAFGLRKFVLKGEADPMVLELPPYRLPGLRNVLLTVGDRAMIFLRNAGSVILVISVVLWALATYPRLAEADIRPETLSIINELRARAETSEPVAADELRGQAERIVAGEALAHSFAGRIGRAAEPIFRPLGFDWKINIGVLTSFAAREMIAATLRVIYRLSDDEENADELLTAQRQQRHADGTPVFGTPTCLSLLVFFVLAMQCLPTQVVTRRETGTWKWAAFQLIYMTALAWSAAFVTYQTTTWIGLS